MRVFRVFKGRKILFLTLAVVIIAFLTLKSLDPLERRLWGVQKDVFFLDQCLSGMLETEVAAFLAEQATSYFLEPVDALEDPDYEGGVLPHLTGFQLAVEETQVHIMEAKGGERITPVLQAVEPKISLKDFPVSPIYRGNPLIKQVSFMINVAWGNEYLPAMLAVLEQEEVRATFFLVGRWAEKNEEMVKELLARGHELASHGYGDGIILTGLSEKEAAADIQKSIQIIEGYGKEKIRYMTPHKGEHDAAALKACSLLDVRMVLWSLDTADWLNPGVERMLERTVQKAFNGAVILMHPTKDGAAYLRAAIPELREQGLRVVPIGTLFNPRTREDLQEGADEP